MKKSVFLLAIMYCIVSMRGIEAMQMSIAPVDFRIEEQNFQRNGITISGELFIPERTSPMPLVILSHGFGGNRGSVRNYAKFFAEQGIAAYIFDFIGGGNNIKSGGKMTDMSVLTEAEDLMIILDHLKTDERFNAEQFFLFGESQGGFVSTYVAAKRPTEIAGLVLLYPAYVLQDDARRRTPDPANIPATMNLMGITIGRIYNQDALSFDIYTMMPRYSGKTLIIHGTADSTVPLSYSERAVTVFPNAELVKINGAKHGFHGNTMQQAAQTAVQFVQMILDETNPDE